MSHNLRICNAYPYVSTLGVRKGKEDLRAPPSRYGSEVCVGLLL